MLIFVGGIHGVGKSHLCEQYARSNGYLHATASALIKEQLSVVNWDDSKQVKDIKKNQDLLVLSLRRLQPQFPFILLDGHFALANTNGEIVPVEEGVFAELNIDGVVLIENSAELIRGRLLKRDKSVSTLDIDKFMFVERENMKSICHKLKIKNSILMAPTQDEFNQAIDDIAHKN